MKRKTCQFWQGSRERPFEGPREGPELIPCMFVWIAARRSFRRALDRGQKEPAQARQLRLIVPDEGPPPCGRQRGRVQLLQGHSGRPSGAGTCGKHPDYHAVQLLGEAAGGPEDSRLWAVQSSFPSGDCQAAHLRFGTIRLCPTIVESLPPILVHWRP